MESAPPVDDKLWWTVVLVVSTAVGLARRGYVHYVEQGKPAAEVFLLRANSLSYLTVSAIFAILAAVLSFHDELGEGVGVVGIILAEHIAICLWLPYFENNDFIPQYVAETKRRLQFLLRHGLGMSDTEFDHFCEIVEEQVVEFWRQKLGHKKWSSIDKHELGKMMFESGVEIGKVMTQELSEDVLFDVAAFMREWLSELECVRVPHPVKKKMLRGDSDEQALSCVGIILANETKEVRDLHEKHRPGPWRQQFPASRIARRKAAAEGILHWPDCLSRFDDITISNIVWNTDKLRLKKNNVEQLCSYSEIPVSVASTLVQMIKAGYLRISPDGKISADITFKYSNMVFKKDEWNQLRTIERKPFRFITSATWMSGDPAFTVENREIANSIAELAGFFLAGSASLEGVLHVGVDVHVEQEARTWLDQVNEQNSEDIGWGKTSDFIKPKGQYFWNWPILWAMRATWRIFQLGVVFRDCFVNIWEWGVKNSEPAEPRVGDTTRPELMEAFLRSSSIREAEETLCTSTSAIAAFRQSPGSNHSSGSHPASDEGPSDLGPSDRDDVVEHCIDFF